MVQPKGQVSASVRTAAPEGTNTLVTPQRPLEVQQRSPVPPVLQADPGLDHGNRRAVFMALGALLC